MPPTLLEPKLLERIKGLSLVARRIVEGSLHGLHRSPLHGLSIEFAQHREYSPGDDLKHLDWKVIGRSDRYVIKQYQQETNLRAMLIVDCSRSMAFGSALERPAGPGQAGLSPAAPEAKPTAPPAAPAATGGSKFDYARTVAAALAYLLIHQGDSVGLLLVAEGIQGRVEPAAKPGQVISICHALENCQPTGATTLALTLGQIAVARRRRSLIVVISDLLDDPVQVLSALGQLHHAGHDVVVFHVLDPHEIDFDLGPSAKGITVLRDMETGAEFEAEPALIRHLVRAEVKRYLQLLDSGSRRHGLHLHRCPTDVPVEQALTAYLSFRAGSR